MDKKTPAWHETFSQVHARWVILVLFVGFVLPWIVGARLWPKALEATVPNIETAILGLASHGLTCLLIWQLWGRNRGVTEFFGESPHWVEARILLVLGIPMVGVAFFCAYVLYLPLSYVAPTFVSWWLLEYPPLLVWTTSAEAVVTNCISVLTLVLVAPIVEEIVFRGFLLYRWREKYGEVPAIALSSALFAVMHVEVLGAVVFSVVLSILCLRRNSLVGPILVHIGNNLVAVLFMLVDGAIFGGGELSPTVEEFRAYWWLAPAGAIVGIPWLIWFARTRLSTPIPVPQDGA